jgi:hypothetical protein
MSAKMITTSASETGRITRVMCGVVPAWKR